MRQLIVRSADDLTGLWIADVPREPTLLRLELPGFEPKTLRRWEDRLNARLNACGCMTGAALALLTLLGIALWQGLFDGWSLARWPMFEMRAVPAVAIAILAGKIIGIRAARWDLRRVARRIERRLH